MDATPKGPPVPPTPDILSPLFSRGISDLNAGASFCAPYRRQRCRRISRHTSLDARRTTEATAYAPSSSFTCLNFSRLFRCKLKLLPILCLRVPKNQPVRTRKSNVATEDGTPTLTTYKSSRSWCRSAVTTVRTRTSLSSSSKTKRAYLPIATIHHRSNGDSKPFFTLGFTPRPPCPTFDAFSTTPTVNQCRRAGKVLLKGVTYPVKHIYRLRPKAPNSELQPNRLREQCRAALPRVLCKVSVAFN